MPQSVSNLIMKLKPYWLDSAAVAMAIEINKIILLPTAGPAVFYDKTAAQLTAALAAASSGDTVLINGPCTLSDDFSIPAGVTLRGVDRDAVIIDGQIEIGSGSQAEGLSIVRSENDASDLIGILNTNAADPAVVLNCRIDITQAGAGDAIAISATEAASTTRGTLHVKYCHLNGDSTGGAGYAVRSTAGLVYVWHSRMIGSTDRITLL